MNAAKKWVLVMRLATIPLALSSIGLGSFLVGQVYLGGSRLTVVVDALIA
jgi:hypothetical protein